jgi:hypothetical protein
MFRTVTNRPMRSAWDRQPATPLEQMHRSLLQMAEQAPFFGTRAKLHPAEMGRRLYLPDPVEQTFPRLLDALVRMGLATPPNVDECGLTLEG